MKKLLVSLGTWVALLGTATTALAAGDPEPRHRWLGAQIDVGVPDGAALGIVVRPQVEWLRLEAAGTYNGLAPGGRLNLTLDPISFPVAPTLTIDGGFTGQGAVPGHSADMPTVGYDYLNLHLGLELGNPRAWRFFLHGGPSYLHVSTGNFSSVASGSANARLGDPVADVWVVPTLKMGLALYF